MQIKLVFNILNKINYGYLEIHLLMERFKFGNPEDNLKANLIIKNQILLIILLEVAVLALLNVICEVNLKQIIFQI